MTQEDLTYEGLRARYKEIACLIAENPDSPDMEERVRALVPSGIYRHFKSTEEETKHYAIYGPARDVDNGIFRAAYVALYPPHAGKLALRQLIGRNPKTGKHDAFLNPVRRAGYAGPRFTLVEPCSVEELPEAMRRYLRA